MFDALVKIYSMAYFCHNNFIKHRYANVFSAFPAPIKWGKIKAALC